MLAKVFVGERSAQRRISRKLVCEVAVELIENGQKLGPRDVDAPAGDSGLSSGHRECKAEAPRAQVAATESTAELTRRLKAEALRLGFSACGVCPAVEATRYPLLAAWIQAGYAGEMTYFEKRLPAYRHPRGVLPSVRSLVMLTHNYRTDEPAQCRPGFGRVSRYAWGNADYHDVIRQKLHRLADWLRGERPDVHVRGVVDTAPLLERDYAQLAGLGWIGKNTLLLRPGEGSWFFLAALLVDCPLEYDQPFTSDHCGTCRACLDACPTGAFVQPYVLDATRCISYLTIELRSMPPEELRHAMGDWLFGCDVCQEVCPWNRRSPRATEPCYDPQPHLNPVDLVALFEMNEEQFRQVFRHVPLWRACRAGLLRNAAIVLGNQRAENARAALEKGLHDEHPLVRAACAWALRQFGDQRARAALKQRQDVETDPMVIAELTDADTSP
jgi:epoxyqueuosine reductase